MKIKELRTKTGLSQSKFAAFIPMSVRTLQDWEQGKRTPPDYVVSLIEYKLRNEGLLKNRPTQTE